MGAAGLGTKCFDKYMFAACLSSLEYSIGSSTGTRTRTQTVSVDKRGATIGARYFGRARSRKFPVGWRSRRQSTCSRSTRRPCASTVEIVRWEPVRSPGPAAEATPPTPRSTSPGSRERRETRSSPENARDREFDREALAVTLPAAGLRSRPAPGAPRPPLGRSLSRPRSVTLGLVLALRAEVWVSVC